MNIYDISEWQGADVDFAKLKTSADGVIARVQAGSTHADKLYPTYVQNMKAVGLPFGTYAYFKGISVDDSVQEAKDALSRMDKDSKFFALDIEEATMTDLVAGGQAYVDYLRANGVEKIGLYSGEYFYKEHNLDKITGIDFLWLAKYNANDGTIGAKPSVPCDLWQYTSVGKADGIIGNVDVSVLNGTKPLDYFFGIAPQVQDVPKPQPTPAPTPAPKPQPKPASQTYTIVSGDNVTNIAKKFGVSVDAIVQANGLKDGGNYIYPGEVLTIPNGQAIVHSNVYTVANGDNLTNIAKKFGTTVDAIVRANSLPNGGNLIFAGQKLAIPNGSLPATHSVPREYHAVVWGDTLSGIAVKYGTTVNAIKNLNGLHSDMIYAGQNLRVK